MTPTSIKQYNIKRFLFDYILDYIGIIQKMKKARSLENSRFLTLQSTGDERIELPPKVLETPIIPFDQSPIQLSLNSSDLLSIPYGVMNVKKKIKKIQEMFQGWFSNSESNYNAFIKAMLRGNVKEMNTYMNEVALATFNSFDTGRHPSGKSQPERFYPIMDSFWDFW